MGIKLTKKNPPPPQEKPESKFPAPKMRPPAYQMEDNTPAKLTKEEKAELKAEKDAKKAEKSEKPLSKSLITPEQQKIVDKAIAKARKDAEKARARAAKFAKGDIDVQGQMEG